MRFHGISSSAFALLIALGCTYVPRATESQGSSQHCLLVSDGFGPEGKSPVTAERIIDNLEVPWGIAFITASDWLITERPGRLRLVRDGKLQPEPVARVDTGDTAEGGLLGVALHPGFDKNRVFFLYVTTVSGDEAKNRVERWKLSEDANSAHRLAIVMNDIPAGKYHNGGRLRIGPDDKLYIGTGDARDFDKAQDPGSLAGKLLRLNSDGTIPADNPIKGSPVYLTGIRNTQGFDWWQGKLYVSDHGPSGELLRWGHDEVTLAKPGANLGWPKIYGCDKHSKMLSPSIVWEDATPPGGAAFYTGTSIRAWRGSFLIGVLGARHLHRVVFKTSDPHRVEKHEVYFKDTHGRLRDVIMGPDGALYVTTSNCDGRGDCPPEGDAVLRVAAQ